MGPWLGGAEGHGECVIFKDTGIQPGWKVYLFPVAFVADYHKLGDLKQQKLSSHSFWSPEAESQGVDRVSSLQKL